MNYKRQSSDTNFSVYFLINRWEQINPLKYPGFRSFLRPFKDSFCFALVSQWLTINIFLIFCIKSLFMIYSYFSCEFLRQVVFCINSPYNFRLAQYKHFFCVMSFLDGHHKREDFYVSSHTQALLTQVDSEHKFSHKKMHGDDSIFFVLMGYHHTSLQSYPLGYSSVSENPVSSQISHAV